MYKFRIMVANKPYYTFATCSKLRKQQQQTLVYQYKYSIKYIIKL